MSLILPPTPQLRPYVAFLWLGERPVAVERERVLPSGGMHVAIRLQGGPVQVYDGHSSSSSRGAGDALVAGPYATAYWKDASTHSRTIGAQLLPGAARALFGVSAAEFCGRHVSLDEVWGQDNASLRDSLDGTPDPRAQIAALESMLLTRLKSPRARHPGIAHALAQMHAAPTAARLPATSGISQRHFIAQFRDVTGLSPKRYARVLRFQQLLEAMKSGEERPLAELALAAGYSDQSHCQREFVEFSGITPQTWRRQHRIRAGGSSKG